MATANLKKSKELVTNTTAAKKIFLKWGLKGGISIDADSGPPR